ncbi:EscU/YscU/HrcU family type III secretion system export apparatus switch protein [Bradyrhizobium pachyrhizi]|uniref:EscU/YscU/HrcU family type III secretion system export apparatus switch protein n=1 Tax=Bradyrhizobium TaxID=374 RepID=UPI0024B1A5FE|nr:MULTISPECIES: EscU/YscU/HrcU family type III secretion system export apparatus switch protein [Bradyrhizobium]WFU54880.1 EscU/YscU/HrcU family type III secretion system export apparatus switch protein [Bradyrhizobium pachyrhizi]WOH80672.1 EscU/YscU/HrcU family type III secretion system export apparatus switch protein [Bradyrhizobium sp. BEA-2-5]
MVGRPACTILMTVLANGGLVFSSEPMTLKLQNIDRIKGLKRIAFSRSIVEVGKTLVKVLCLGAIFLLVVGRRVKAQAHPPICGMACFDFRFIEVKPMIGIASGASHRPIDRHPRPVLLIFARHAHY